MSDNIKKESLMNSAEF